MRQSLGTAVFAGMLGVTLFGLLFTPVFYVLARRGAGLSRQPVVEFGRCEGSCTAEPEGAPRFSACTMICPEGSPWPARIARQV